jgi:hypothetical protein
MSSVAIYLRLVLYPLLALGLFLLASTCNSRRLTDRILLVLFSIMSLGQLAKAYQVINYPDTPIPMIEWVFFAVVLATCAVVWYDFYISKKVK